ncbi:CU044_2847 family protein [Streptomyces scopuliridis]|uniref:CU044_2847 family protein n=1 Tax=Streptomyces scopuliridis TaxID=452529 RepID=UPI003693F4B8
MFRDGSLKPDGVELEFGVKLMAEAGAVIAKTSAEGHMTVKLSWNPGTTGESSTTGEPGTAGEPSAAVVPSTAGNPGTVGGPAPTGDSGAAGSPGTAGR